MQRVSAHALLDDAQTAHQRAVELHHSGALTPAEKSELVDCLGKAERGFNLLLNNDPSNPVLAYMLGTVLMQKQQHGAASHLLKYAVTVKPQMAEAWNNLGICFRSMRKNDMASLAWDRAHQLSPDNADIPANHAAIYLGNGTPEKALELVEQSLKIDPKSPGGKWHKALALLEMQQFDTAWAWHESRLDNNSPGINVGRRNYHANSETPWWDGWRKERVAIHGEQGLGDEIMFLSCIPDALERAEHITIECAPRLGGLIRRSFPRCTVYGTHGEHKDTKADSKLAMGSLPKFFRKSVLQFPGTPYLVADPERREKYRDRLAAMGRRPKVGLAWQGGVGSTGVEHRSLALEELKPKLPAEFDYISLQYNDGAAEEAAAHGVVHWPEAASGKDMDDQAALIAELDCVFSVCQTAIHVAGGLAVPTFCLVPSKPSWRYGVKGDKMPWYRSVKLFRQKAQDWAPAIDAAIVAMRKHLTMKAAA